ncbi:MAG: DUF2203 domain-containing protein [Phycisphaerae bacterium]|nr:DUF2203 domain-containing protein [Phycisphaerae bacterium]
MGEFDSVVLSSLREGKRKPKYFSVNEANRSLVLVSMVVKDILALYCRAKVLEERYSVLDRETERGPRKQIKRQYEALLKQLQCFNQELTEVGCRLRDWQTGAVDWPAIYQDREVYLCWRMGEETVEYYHEAYESFAARRRLPEDIK